MSPQGTFTPTASGAIATVVWESCRAAQNAGVTPIVVSRSSRAEPYRGVKTFLVDYPTIPRNPLLLQLARLERRVTGWSDLRQRTFAHRLVAVIRKEGLHRFPIVLNNDPNTAVLLRQNFPDAFLVHHFHNQFECKPRFRHRFAASVNVLTAVSDYTARWAESYYALPSGTVRTVYNGVDTEQYFPADPNPEGLPVVNFVGRTGMEKAPDLLLRAATLAARRGRRFALQIIGSNHWDRYEKDEYQRELDSLVQELEGLNIPVRRPGHIDRYQLPSEFRKAHIHVVPSRWEEPFGLTTVEGMASGLATIASRTGGTPEVVGDAGLLFTAGSDVELAERLELLIDDAGMRRDYAERARTRAEEFTWSRSWAQLHRLLPQ